MLLVQNEWQCPALCPSSVNIEMWYPTTMDRSHAKPSLHEESCSLRWIMLFRCFHFSIMQSPLLVHCCCSRRLLQYRGTKSYGSNGKLVLGEFYILMTFDVRRFQFLSRWGRGIWLDVGVRSLALCLAWHHPYAIGRLVSLRVFRPLWYHQSNCWHAVGGYPHSYL